jgi:N-acyl homoserine lactone hydrolase
MYDGLHVASSANVGRALLMRLMGVRCGGFVTDIGSFLGTDQRGVRAEVPVMCFIVDTGDGVLVFDTGMHESCCDGRAPGRYGRLLERFELVCQRDMLIDARVRQAGFTSDDVRWVANSHLHFDHAGGNESFPSASHLIRDREVQFARVRMQKATGYLAPEIEAACSLAQAWDYDDRFELAAGVAFRHLPGHTPWHQGLEINFGDGRSYLCIGDASYSLEAVASERPTGYVADREVTATTLRALKDADRDGVVLLSSHDVDQWREVIDVVLIHEA